MRKLSFSKIVTSIGLAAALCLPSMSSAIAAWPEKSIEMVCATSPGSGAANWCQLFARMVGKNLGQTIHVLFKGGGGGNAAAAYVASRPADGYTWLQRNTSYAGYMNMPTFKPNPEDFEVMVEVEKFLCIIGVPGDSKYNKFEDVVKDMKANPGRISVAGNKPGSAHHRHLINLFKAFGVKWNYVPYKGSGGAMKDVIGKHVPVGIGPPGIWLPHVKSGKARFLLLLDDKRSDRMPGIPIPKEFGKDYEFTHQVQGMFAKIGTPKAVKEKIVAAFEKATHSATYKEYTARSPHVVPQFSGDIDENTKRFHKIRIETGRFLREAGLIR